MDAVEFLEDPTAVPERGSLSMCLSCGAMYVMRKKWKPLTDQQLRALPKRLKDQITIVERARKKVITEDLALNQKLKESGK